MVKKFITFMLATILMISCKKDEVVSTYTPPDGSYALIYNKIFAPSCALSGCHANDDHEKENHDHAVTLSGSEAYNYLINYGPKNAQAIQAGLSLVTPGDTTKSFLYHKINYDNSPYKYGAPMPGGGLVLTKNQITFIKQWIMAGAPLNGHVADKNLLN